MKTVLILFFLIFHFENSYAASYIKMDAAMESSLNTSIESIIDSALDEEEQADEGISPTVAGMRDQFFELVYSLYLSGYLNTQEYETFKVDYNNLQDVPVPSEGWSKEVQKAQLKAHFKSFFSSKFASFKASPEKCTEYLGIANHGQCCQGLVLAPHSNYSYPSNSCKKASLSCTAHSQCCTGVCGGLEDSSDGKGICEPVKTCFQEIPNNSECGVNNPICKNREEGAACIEVNYNSSNAGTCSANGNSCSKNTECCSDKCSAGKCVESFKCLECKRRGEKPKNKEMCCPGLYPGVDGKCIQDWPPFILPSSTSEVKKEKSLFEIVFTNLFIGSVYAADGDENKCTAPCNHISHLPSSQRSEVEKMQKDCVQNSEDEEARKSCLQGALSVEQGYYAKHKADGTISESKSTLDMEKFVSEYNVPLVTAEGLSDVKECRFNSMKDDWNDASNLEKNAEVTLRAFEYVYSGNGDDWWKNGGKTIFERVKKVATGLRHNRYNYIENLKANDIRMSCLCIAAFGGVSKFPDRSEFYANNCANNQEVQDDLAALNIQDNGGNNVDGETGVASNTDQQNTVDNVNQGASGLKHEALLVSWLSKRANIQMQRFVDNSELEEEMQQTIEYIRTEPWSAPENTEMNDDLLYKFAIKWTAGWVKFVLVVIAIIAAVVLTIVTFGGATALFAVLGTTITVGAASVAVGVALIGISTALLKNPQLTPKHFDKKIKSNEKWNRLGTAKFDGYERYLVYPKSKLCKINGPTTLCLKNAFVSSKSKPDEEVILYLIDIQSPLFVNPSKIKYNINFAGPSETTMVNAAYKKGYNLLKKTHPPKSKSKPRWNGYYARKNEGYLGRDIFTHYFYNDAGNVKYNVNSPDYKPLIMAFAPTYELPLFNDEMKNEFINGVKKFAKCYNLKKCLTEAGLAQGYNSQGGTEVSNEIAAFSDSDIGLKLFFSNSATGEINEAEVEAFAEYAYQLHFLWPNTSEENTLSYPLPGMVPYFEAILYNIKLLGSLNADRAGRYAETWQAYDADWQKRFSDYNVNAGKMGLGERSKNVKFGQKFFAKFRTLDLAGGGNLEAYQSMMDEATSSGQYSTAELQALQAGVSKAIRAAQDKKRYAHYQNTVGKTERGLSSLKKAKSFMNSFNSPIDSFPQSANSKFAGANSNNASSPLTETKSKETTKPYENTYTPQDFSTASFDSGVSFSSGSREGISKEQLNKDISNTEAEHMIMSSEKDKSLYEDNPADTLFTKVSKAYKRNLDRVLIRKNDLAQSSATSPEKATHSDISKEDKESLKKLLDKN